MNQPKKVLVIGRHADILHRIVGMLNEKGYEASGQLTNEEALRAFSSEQMDAVIIGGGVDRLSRDLFYAEFTRIKPDVKIIDAHPQTVMTDLEKAFS